jgi:uncharacterized protein YciI
MFAVTTMQGPSWNPGRGIREQDLWAEHAAYADGLLAAGTIVFGGPVQSPDTRVVALLAVAADDEQAVHRAFADDPWLVAGILRLMDVRKWTIWLDGRGGAAP